MGIKCVTPPSKYEPILEDNLPDIIRTMRDERDIARERKDYARADTLRNSLQEAGYRVEDGIETTLLYKEEKMI